MKIVEVLDHSLLLRPHIILLVISLCSLSFCEENGKEYQADYGKALGTTTFHSANKDTNFNYRRSPRKTRKQRQGSAVNAQGKQDSCNLTLDDSATFDFHEMLADNSGINIVAFRLFNGSENDNSIFQNMTACWIWASALGQAILSVLPEPDYSKCTLEEPIGTFPVLVTLTVAKKNFDVRLHETPNGCLGNITTTERVILVTTVLQQHFLSDQLTKNRLCYRLLSAESEPEFHCCKFNGKLKKSKINDQPKCDTNPRIKGMLAGTSLVMAFLIFLALMYLSEVEEPEREFLKTTENPLSVLSIMLKIFWIENGLLTSILRLIFECVFIFMTGRIMGGDAYVVAIIFLMMMAFSVLIFLLSSILSRKMHKLRSRRAVPVEQHPLKEGNMGLEWWEPDCNACVFRITMWPLKCLVLSVTCLISLKHWQWKISSWYKDISQRLCCHGQMCQPVLNCICATCLCFFKSIGYLLKILLLIICTILVGILFGFKQILSNHTSNYKIILFMLYCFQVTIMWRVTIIILTLLIIPDLLLGLLLNAEYYMTYLTFCSVIIFYTIHFWNSVQEQYFSLKSNIYKVCKEKFQPSSDHIMLESKNMSCLGNDRYTNLDDVNNNIMVWKYDEESVPMISKDLYDHITEKLLPYNFQVFHYLVKLLIVFVFAYCIIFKISHLLMPVDISPSIKVLLTAFAGAIPYILNILGGRKSEEEKRADCEAQINKIEKIILELCLVHTNEPVSPSLDTNQPVSPVI